LVADINSVQQGESKMKFWHVTVFEKTKTIFTRRCLTVKEANELFAEKKKEYPSPQYIVLKENF
jgi:hypothetical protein